MAVRGASTLILAAVLFSGCGAVDSLNFTTSNTSISNDAGPSTAVKLVSGVVVSSVPVANRVVVFQGSNGSAASGLTDGNGNYSVNVATLTPPYIVSVASVEGGKTIQYYSFAREEGVVNINPLTNLAVLAATGEADPYAYLAGSDTAKINRIDSSLDAAWTTISTKLQPLISVFISGTFNPITSNYTSVIGLHNFFGLVGFSVNNGTLTLTNLNKGTVIASAPVTGIATMTLDHAEFPSGSVPAVNGPIITSATAVQGGALDILGSGFMASGLDVVKLIDHAGATFDLTNFWYPDWFPSRNGDKIMRVLPANVAIGGATLTVTSISGSNTTASAPFYVTVRALAPYHGPVVSRAVGSRGDTMSINGTGFTTDGTDSVKLTDSSGSPYVLSIGRQGWIPSGTGTEIQLSLPFEIKAGPALITVNSNGQASPPFYLTIQ